MGGNHETAAKKNQATVYLSYITQLYLVEYI